MAGTGKPIVLITGISGEIGEVIANALCDAYEIVGMDKKGDPKVGSLIEADLTSDHSVEQALERFRDLHGAHIASVLHLAAYFDFTGEDNPLYHRLNVEGTRRLLQGLKRFRAEQFVYSGTMLVHAAVSPGEHIDESRRIDPQWIYPRSKAEAEDVIRRDHGAMPYALLHLAGAYDEQVVVPTLAHQIARIYERDFESHVYPGNRRTGQTMVHREDLADAFRRTVDRRGTMPGATTLLIGEPDPIGYDALQDMLGMLIHGEHWTTLRVPATLAAAGAWMQEKILPHLPERLGGGEPFVRPFMTWEANDHYALDITRARDVLGWAPSHRLADELPLIIAALKRDPKGWYKANKLGSPPAA